MPCAHLTDGPLVVAVDSSTQSTKAIIVDGAGVLAMAAIQSQLYQQLRQTNANLDQLRTNQNA